LIFPKCAGDFRPGAFFGFSSQSFAAEKQKLLTNYLLE